MKLLLNVVFVMFSLSFLINCGSNNDTNNMNNDNQDMGTQSKEDMSSSNNEGVSDLGNTSNSLDMSSGNNVTGSCATDADCTETDGNSLANPNKRYCVSVTQSGNNEVRFCSECRTAADCPEEGAICSFNSGRCLNE